MTPYVIFVTEENPFIYICIYIFIHIVCIPHQTYCSCNKSFITIRRMLRDVMYVIIQTDDETDSQRTDDDGTDDGTDGWRTDDDHGTDDGTDTRTEDDRSDDGTDMTGRTYRGRTTKRTTGWTDERTDTGRWRRRDGRRI